MSAKKSILNCGKFIFAAIFLLLLGEAYYSHFIQLPIFMQRIAAHSYWCWLLSNQETQSIEIFFNHAQRIITLDPHFVFAYRYSFIYGTVWHNRPDLAHALLSKAKQSTYACADTQLREYISYCPSSPAAAAPADAICETPCV